MLRFLAVAMVLCGLGLILAAPGLGLDDEAARPVATALLLAGMGDAALLLLLRRRRGPAAAPARPAPPTRH